MPQVGSSLQGTLYYWCGKLAFRCVLASSLALALGGIRLAAQAADNDPPKTVAFQPATQSSRRTACAGLFKSPNTPSASGSDS